MNMDRWLKLFDQIHIIVVYWCSKLRLYIFSLFSLSLSYFLFFFFLTAMINIGSLLTVCSPSLYYVLFCLSPYSTAIFIELNLGRWFLCFVFLLTATVYLLIIGSLLTVCSLPLSNFFFWLSPHRYILLNVLSAGDWRCPTPRERELAGSVRPPPAVRLARGHAPADELRRDHGYVTKVHTTQNCPVLSKNALGGVVAYYVRRFLTRGALY